MTIHQNQQLIKSGHLPAHSAGFTIHGQPRAKTGKLIAAAILTIIAATAIITQIPKAQAQNRTDLAKRFDITTPL